MDFMGCMSHDLKTCVWRIGEMLSLISRLQASTSVCVCMGEITSEVGVY